VGKNPSCNSGRTLPNLAGVDECERRIYRKIDDQNASAKSVALALQIEIPAPAIGVQNAEAPTTENEAPAAE